MEAPVATSLSSLNKMAPSSSAVVSTSAGTSGAEPSSQLFSPQTTATTLSLNLRDAHTQKQDAAHSKSGRSASSKVLKGGLTLVFDPGMDGPEEECMEELRASQSRYQKMLERATAKAS